MPLPGGVLSPTDRDRLVGAEQGQRALTGRVTDPAQGLRAKADLLRETVQANNLPRSNTTDRVGIVATELGRTADRDLGTAQQNLADALRLVGQPAKPEQDKELADYLRRAGRSQKSIEDTASALLDLLALWGGAGEIRGEARVQKDNVLRQLNALEQLKERVKEGKLNLTDDERRDLDRAAVRAEQAAEQAGQLIGRATGSRRRRTSTPKTFARRPRSRRRTPRRSNVKPIRPTTRRRSRRLTRRPTRWPRPRAI